MAVAALERSGPSVAGAFGGGEEGGVRVRNVVA